MAQRQIATADVTGALGYAPLSLGGGTLVGPLVLSRDPVSDMEAATKEYVDNISATATSVAESVTSSVAELNAGVATLTTTVGTYSSQIATLNTEVGTYTASISTLNSEVATLNSEVGTNTSAISTLNTEVGTNTASISTLNSEVATLNSEVGTNTSAISTLNTQVGTNTTAISTLQSEAGAANGLATLNASGTLTLAQAPYTAGANVTISTAGVIAATASSSSGGPGASIFFNGQPGSGYDADSSQPSTTAFPFIQKSTNIAALTFYASGTYGVSFTKAFPDSWFTVGAMGQFDNAVNDFTIALISEPRGVSTSNNTIWRGPSNFRFVCTYQGTSSSGFNIRRVALNFFA